VKSFRDLLITRGVGAGEQRGNQSRNCIHLVGLPY